MTRQFTATAATCLMVFLTTACGGSSVVDPEAPQIGSTSPSPAEPSATRTPSESHSPRATPHERRILRDFVAFAVEPNAATAARVPFAPLIRLGLSRDLTLDLDRSSVARASAWLIDAEYFRAYSGPFSALRVIKRHAASTQSASVDGHASAFRASVGEHPHCASPPVPAPKGYGTLRRISIQPSENSIDSCIFWFTVDLFVDEEGQVTAVTLDLWEP